MEWFFKMKAWEYEYETRINAKPVDLNKSPGDWSGISDLLNSRKAMLDMLWKCEVPGSRAPEHLFLEMIQAWHNRGYNVTAAEALIEEALSAHRNRDFASLERLSGQIQRELRKAPKDPENPYWSYKKPETWDEIKAAFRNIDFTVRPAGDITEKVLRGWLGQIAGGAYGTALEGYTGSNLQRTYGNKLNWYVREPETLNDDITFEIAFLKAAEKKGRDISSADIADMWLQFIPFGWSAEYFALENLKRGIYPPESGKSGNFFSEWIGAQMRTMVCGLIVPGNPLKAAYYAYTDSCVSHETNGIYGGIHSAVLTSLAFVIKDSKELLEISRYFIPDNTQFAAFFDEALKSVKHHSDHISSWESMSEKIKTYNWVHTYPNMIAVVHALWYCENNIGKAFRILADCGMDVDCNAGEVGCALGVMNPIESIWTDPLNNTLQTYIPGMEKIKITDLAEWTINIYEHF